MLLNPFIWSDSGGEPTEADILISGFIENVSNLIITDVLTGGEIYEPQS